jgi:hypothetical protein
VNENKPERLPNFRENRRGSIFKCLKSKKNSGWLGICLEIGKISIVEGKRERKCAKRSANTGFDFTPEHYLI